MVGWIFDAQPASAQRVVADFNGDGIDDLAIGAPGANDGRGSVTIVFGGPSNGISVNTPDRTITGLFAEEAYGSALAVGNLDGTGRAELAVGAPEWASARGRVEVIRFSRSGAPTVRRSFDENSTGGFAAPNERFGAALAIGDFDHDGTPDLAVGAPDEDIGAKPNVGSVTVLYGSLLDDGAVRSERWNQELNVVGSGVRDDHFGFALSANDFDGDGSDDLAVGVPYKDVSYAGQGTFTDQGAVYIIDGGPDGLSKTSQRSIIIGDPLARGLFGFALAAGDFNGDRVYDLAIGAPRASYLGALHAGSVVVVYNGRPPFRTLAPQDIDLVDFAAYIGWALAAGDFNNDGIDDLAIGAPGKKVAGQSGAGAVNVLYGVDNDDNRRVPHFGTSQILNQNTYGIDDSSEFGDWFGTALTAGDFNGDGVTDLAIGVPTENVGSNADVGAVAVVSGTSSGLQTGDDRLLLPATRHAGGKFGLGLGK